MPRVRRKLNTQRHLVLLRCCLRRRRLKTCWTDNVFAAALAVCLESDDASQTSTWLLHAALPSQHARWLTGGLSLCLAVLLALQAVVASMIAVVAHVLDYDVVTIMLVYGGPWCVC